jgi:dihydroorotase
MANHTITGRIYGEGDVVDIEINSDTGKIDNISPSSDVTNPNIILPGLVDLHVHLREPGQERSETIETGAKAAAAGGFTCVFAMANTIPVTDTAPAVERSARIGEDLGICEIRPIGAVTQGLNGEKLAELAAMADSKAKVRVFSDDGKCVHDPLLMRRALEYSKLFDGVIAQHSQDPRLTEGAQMNEGAVSSELGLQGWPAVAEESIIARDILLAQLTGAKLHICHLSTKNSVEIVRFAKSKGINVTAEVTPHHLMLTQEMLREYNPRYKVNPPLRSDEDIAALKEGLKDGTIDIIATDHAPHALELKYCNFQDSAFGMTGLETSLRVAQKALVDEGYLSWRDIARVMCETPARIGQVTDTQARPIAQGELANLCLYNPSVSSEIIPEEQLTRSTNTPFKRFTLPGQVVSTFYRGVQTH